jgi:hypothetical protein
MGSRVDSKNSPKQNIVAIVIPGADAVIRTAIGVNFGSVKK